MFFDKERKWGISSSRRLFVLLMAALFMNESCAFVTPISKVPGSSTAFLNDQPQKSGSSSSMMMMLPLDDWSGISSSLTTLAEQQPLLTEDDIATAFKVATLGPQLLWTFIILLPNANITKRIMGGIGPIFAFSLVHFFIVVASLFQDGSTAPMAEFSNVFDSALPAKENLAAMSRMFTFPNFVSEEWSHVLTWDLFVGRWIWLDGLRRGIFTAHSVLLCNLIGPPGFLLHLLTCAVTGKDFPSNEALLLPMDNDNDTTTN